MVLICVLPQVALWGMGKVCTNRTQFTLILSCCIVFKLFTAIEIAIEIACGFEDMLDYKCSISERCVITRRTTINNDS